MPIWLIALITHLFGGYVLAMVLGDMQSYTHPDEHTRADWKALTFLAFTWEIWIIVALVWGLALVWRKAHGLK